MNTTDISEAAKAVVRRNTDEVQGRGDFALFDELFAEDFVDHTTQPGTTPDKAGVRKLYAYLREAFPELPRRDPLATRGWRSRDGLQDVARYARRDVPGGRSDSPQDTVRNRGRDAGTERKDHRSLGRWQSSVRDAAAWWLDTTSGQPRSSGRSPAVSNTLGLNVASMVVRAVSP
jgi:hypothetical protein